MSKEILDAAVLKQFKDYLETKGKIFDALSIDELDSEQENYIDQNFPGSKGLPNKMVEMMSSPSPSQSIQTQSLVNPEEENVMCTYPMTIQKLSCKHCPDNSHVSNLHTSTSENPTNWTINLSNGPWNKPWSNEMDNGASLECGKGTYAYLFQLTLFLNFSKLRPQLIYFRLDRIQRDRGCTKHYEHKAKGIWLCNIGIWQLYQHWNCTSFS